MLAIAISDITTYQKWTGQPIHLAGSKNPLPLGMGSVKFKYTVGETVEVKDFDPDRWNECSTGIHFFMDRQEAVEY